MTAEADNLDRAAALTQQLADAAVDEVRRAARPEQVQKPDGTWPSPDCECGEAIPEGRLALGKIRCIHCQVLLERRKAGL